MGLIKQWRDAADEIEREPPLLFPWIPGGFYMFRPFFALLGKPSPESRVPGIIMQSLYEAAENAWEAAGSPVPVPEELVVAEPIELFPPMMRFTQREVQKALASLIAAGWLGAAVVPGRYRVRFARLRERLIQENPYA